MGQGLMQTFPRRPTYIKMGSLETFLTKHLQRLMHLKKLASGVCCSGEDFLFALGWQP